MKISRLPLVGRLLDGTERLPIAQDGETRGLTLAMFLNSVAALLPAAFRGPPGGSNNTYARIEDVAANIVPEGTDLIWIADRAAPFRRDPTVGVPDGVFTIKDQDGAGFRFAGYTATGPGSIPREPNEKFSTDLKTVRDKGAKGDRWTDDLAAFQAAIADARGFDQYPAPIVVPSGHYYRSDTIKTPGQAFWRGNGASSILNSQNRDQRTPIVANDDPYGLIDNTFQWLGFYGGTHALKLQADAENANINLWQVSMLLQSVANIEANKLLQTTYLWGGMLGLAPYGVRVNDWTTNLLCAWGTQFVGHSVSSFRLRASQGVTLDGVRFEGRGAASRLRVNDAAMDVGGNILRSLTGGFGAAHVGRGIVVQEALPNGEPLRTAIVEVIDPSTLRLYDAAAVAVVGKIADIDGPFGATIDVEDVNGSFLVQGAYFEDTQEFVLRARRAKNIVFDSCHFTGQKAGYEPAVEGFQPYRWDVDDSIVTLRNCHANLPTSTPRHVRLEGENVNFFPIYAQYWGTPQCGGISAKSADIDVPVINILKFASNPQPAPRNIRGLWGVLSLRYLGYNANGTALREFSAIYDVRVLAGSGTDGNRLRFEITEQALRRVDNLAGGTITLATDATASDGVLAVAFGGNFDMPNEDGHFAWRIDWQSAETRPTEVITVRAA